MLINFKLIFFIFRHLQSPGESVLAQTLSGGPVAGPSRPTLAPLQAALAEGPRRTRVLAVASDVARRTLTRPLHGVAQGPVLALALLAAARPPVFVVAGWETTGQTVTVKNTRLNRGM